MSVGSRAYSLLCRYRSDLLRVPWSDRRELFMHAGDRVDLCRWYGEDPLRFGEEVLGESYTPDVRAYISAVGRCERVLARSATATGKTHGSGAIVAWHALCRPASQTWVCAAPPEGNLLNILWPQIERRYHGHRYLWEGRGWELRTLELRRGWLKSDGLRGSDAERPMVVGVRIPLSGTAQARESKFSGKHAQNLMFVVDEGDAVPSEVYRGIDGCMSGGRVRLIVTFNPRQLSGPVWDMEHSGGAEVVHLSALRHPNVLSGRDVIPGAVSRDITVRRIMEWTEQAQASPEADPTVFEVPASLVGVVSSRSRGGHHPPLPAGRRRIVNHEFAYKVIGEYSPIGTLAQVFDHAYLNMLERRLQSAPPRLVRVIEPGEGLSGHCDIWEEASPRGEYLISADPAEGKDPDVGDYCEAIVFDRHRWTEVAHYHGRCDSHTFGGDLAALGLHYNGAELVVERNNHGAAVLEALLHTHEYSPLYVDDDEEFGMVTTAKRKAQRIDGVRGMLTAMRVGGERGMEWRSLRTISQMKSFGRLGNNRTGGMYGANDDAVSCVCMAHSVLSRTRGYAAQTELPEPLVLYGRRRR